MKPYIKNLLMVLSVLILAVLACGPPAAGDPTVAPPIPTDTVASDPVDPPIIEATATSVPPTEAPTATQPPVAESTATTGPQCIVLQNLNFRSGPGLAYRDPIGFVNKDTVVIPTGYNPVGVPGGSWVLVNNDNQDGWIAAEAEFINCSFDLASLPSIDVPPPPRPLPPGSAQSSDAEGNCGPDEGSPDCEPIFSDDSFIQFKLVEKGNELTSDTGIKQIVFSVREGDVGGREVYNTVESTSAYCIFGGNGPCNAWPLDGNMYVWSPGNPVKEGKYFVEILADYDGNTVRWAAEFTITLP